MDAELFPANTSMMVSRAGTRSSLSCMNEGSVRWAFIDYRESFDNVPAPIDFSNDPTVGNSAVTIFSALFGGDLLYLSRAKTAQADLLYWSTDNTAAIPVRAYVEGGSYKLYYTVGGTVHSIYADPLSGQLYASTASSYDLRLDIGTYTLSSTDITRQLLATWPALDYHDIHFLNGTTYSPIDRSKASAIWQTCDMSSLVYGNGGFDCEDYSLLYKAKAGVAANIANSRAMYAVGLISAEGSDSAHAVCFFVDEQANIYIIEPMNGSIMAAEEWSYTVPNFILL